jgi:hypothetical protein
VHAEPAQRHGGDQEAELADAEGPRRIVIMRSALLGAVSVHAGPRLA